MKKLIITISVLLVICIGFYFGYRQAVLAKLNPPVQVTPIVIEPEGHQTPLTSVEKEEILKKLKENSEFIKDGNIEFYVNWSLLPSNDSEEQIQDQLKGYKEILQNQHQPESLIAQNMKSFETDVRTTNKGFVKGFNLLMSFNGSTVRTEEKGMVTLDNKVNADSIVLLEPGKFEQFIKLNNYLIRMPNGFINGQGSLFRYFGIDKIQNCYANLILTNPDHYEFSKNNDTSRIILKGSIDSTLQSQYYGADSVELELNPNQGFVFNKIKFYGYGLLWFMLQETDITNFKGIQYPHQIKCQFLQNNHPASIYEYLVKSAQFNIPKESLNLAIKLPVGTQVQDNRFSPPLLYKLNSDKDYSEEELNEMANKRKIKTNDIIRM